MPWTNVNPGCKIRFLQLSYWLVNNSIFTVIYLPIHPSEQYYSLKFFKNKQKKISVSFYFFTHRPRSDVFSEPPQPHRHPTDILLVTMPTFKHIYISTLDTRSKKVWNSKVLVILLSDGPGNSPEILT